MAPPAPLLRGPCLKAVYVSAIHKGSDPTSRINYKPISVPSAISKVFERLLEKQIVAKYQICCPLIEKSIVLSMQSLG